MRLRSQILRQRACQLIDAVIILLACISAQTQVAHAEPLAKVHAEWSHVGDTSHLELHGQESWKYELRREEKGKETIIYLQIPVLESVAIEKLRHWTTPLITKVEPVVENQPENKTTLAFHLSESRVQTFDYQVDKPSQLVLDFFIQEDAKKETSSKVAKQSAKPKTKAAERKPANDAPPSIAADEKIGPTTIQAGVYDGSDPNFDRFAIKSYEINPKAILASRQNVYLPFPMLHMPYTEIEEIVSSRPIYQITEKEGVENEQARFLLTLFERNRHAAFLKAYKIFKQKFPASQYDELLQYLYADIHFATFKETESAADFEAAMNAYTELMVRYPQSPMFDRTAILVANAYFEKKEYVRALRMYQKYLDGRPQSPHRDVVKLAMAHAYAGLNQHVDAFNTLQDLTKSAQKEKYATEAQFRLGDAAFIQKKWQQASDLYLQTLKQKPRDIAKHPNIYFNLAEAQFWQGQYTESLESFRNHLRQFPTHPYAAYALTRLGELLEILGADAKRSVAAFLESYFRYYPATGAKIARVRLIAQRMKGMKQKEFDASLKEGIEIGKAEEIPQMEEFVTLALTDGLYRRGDYKHAVNWLIGYYQKNPTSPNLPVFKSRIARILVDDIKRTIDSGEFIAGLDLYDSHSQIWLQGVDRQDLKFYLAQAFERGGVQSEAINRYETILNKVKEDSRAPASVRYDVFDDVPSQEKLHLRLAAVEYGSGHWAKTIEHLKQIKDESTLTDGEKIERVQIAAQVFQKTGQYKDASQLLSQLIETWKGQPELVASPLLQKAQAQAQMEKWADGIQTLEQLVKLQADTQKVPATYLMQALELLGDWNLKLRQPQKAAEHYAALLNEFETKKPMPAVRYRLGQAYFDVGNLKEAEKAWQKISPTTAKAWYQMAQEQMKNDKFKADYKKYIDRIPAMAEMRDQSGGK